MAVISCEELNAVWIVKNRLEREKRNLLDLQIMADPASPPLDGMPHSKPVTCKVERMAAMIIESQQLIDRLNDALAQKKIELLTKLQSLNLHELQQRVLSYHYVACLKFKEIAKLMNFTTLYVNSLHRKALRSLGLTLTDVNKVKHFPSHVD